METLLTLSFDKISSKDPNKIRKGLRQIEGLLAQICLARSATNVQKDRRSSVVIPAPRDGEVKTLGLLTEDLAFREFFRLQESFEWNVATRLVECLERLLGIRRHEQIDHLIIAGLDICHGVLLLHPPSRSLFGREIYMNMLLDLLDPSNDLSILSSTLLLLVTALLDNPRNARNFEDSDGLLTVTSLFKSRSTPQMVKLKVLEFFYFYLMPEASVATPNGPPLMQVLQRSPSKQDNASARTNSSGSSDGGTMVRSTDDKQVLLSKYLNNVADLVQDLRQSTPFGSGVC